MTFEKYGAWFQSLWNFCLERKVDLFGRRIIVCNMKTRDTKILAKNV